MKQDFKISGMSCAACSSFVEKNVSKLEGVQDVQVNLLAGSAVVLYDENIMNDNTIIATIEKGGYTANVKGKQAQAKTEKVSETQQLQADKLRTRFILSVLLLIPLMYISMGSMFGLPQPALLTGVENSMSFALTQLFLTLPICVLNRKFFTSGISALMHKAPNMDSLVAIGSGAAIVYGIFALYMIGYALGHGDTAMAHEYMHDLYFESAGTILTLITLGKWLEARAKGKTGKAIEKLMDLSPKTAIVERDGIELTIPTEEVVVNDIIIVRSGSNIPVDGIIIEGALTIDESSLTGESIPVEKSIDDNIYGATICKSGFAKFRAQKVGEDTTIAQIIKLVEQASASKAPIAKLADKISGVFVPVVISIALISSGLWLLFGQTFSFALSTAIAVLVISCPCALGLATPVAIMVGTGLAAENGILFKNAQSLQALNGANVVVLDKTGTITLGKPTVTDVKSNIAHDELLKIAVSLEKASEHPLAHAIVSYGVEQSIEIVNVKDFKATQGRGISGIIEDKLCIAGNAQNMIDNNIDISAMDDFAFNLSENGKTPLFFAQENKLIGVIAVADVIKDTSAQAVEKLRKMNIETIMLTGDNARTANAIGKLVNVDKVVSDVLPQDKELLIQNLTKDGKCVIMVGDGVNDAPALARADIGIAIGTGVDIAIESADVVLVKSDLLDVVSAINISHKTMRTIKQNLFWAFFYNAIGIPIAAGVLYNAFGLKLNPMIGAAAMSLSSVTVVSNALRLRFSSSNLKTQVNQEIQIVEKIQINKENEKNMKKTLHVKGMMCMHCVAHTKKALEAVEGAENVVVDLEQGTATVEGTASADALKDAVINAGYEVEKIEE